MGISVTLRGGSGDMLKSVYDSNLDGVIAVAETEADMKKSVYDGDDDGVIAFAETEADIKMVTTPSASDNLKASLDTERSTMNVTYTILKRLVIPLRYKSGTFRIKFDLKSGHAAVTATGRIYKNGVEFGSVQTRLGTVYETKSEDLTCEGGDIIDVRAKAPSNGAFVENYRFYCDTEGDALVDGDLAW